MRSVESVRPMPGWAVCRALRPSAQSTKGILYGRDVESGKTTEGVAEVLRVTPAESRRGTPLPLETKPGDKILIRDYLKFAHPIGLSLGEEKDYDVFLLNVKDILAVVDGHVTLGFYGEYEL